ncbi:MAG: cysteine desulfurase family protein [Gracilimonas sp.]
MDHHATTPVDSRVLEKMLPYFSEVFGNAASTDHAYGNEALKAVEKARKQIATGIGAKPEEIIFTSGATESNNLALKGIAEQYREEGNHIITCVTEHPAVLDPCEKLEAQDFEVTYLPVDKFGLIDLDELKNSIRSETILISIMAANNEIGVLAPLKEIGEIAKEYEIFFHTDATQAIGYVPIDVNEMSIDLLSMSSHKVYGPKGVGALYVRKVNPRVRLAEQMNGGGHERGMRSGTLNVAGIVGFGEAVNLAVKIMPEEVERLRKLRDQLFEGLKKEIDGIEINGHPEKRLPHNLNIYIPGIEARSLLVQINDEIALSTGSACSTSKVEPSHVIEALGFDDGRAYKSLRFGLGRNASGHSVEKVSSIIVEYLKKLSALSL